MHSLDSFRKKVEDWVNGIENDLDVGIDELHDMENYLKSELDDIESSADADPEGAYGRVVKLAGVCGHAARRKSHLAGIFARYLHRFISIMQKLQKDMGALSFTISVSFPFDLTLSLTF